MMWRCCPTQSVWWRDDQGLAHPDGEDGWPGRLVSFKFGAFAMLVFFVLFSPSFPGLESAPSLSLIDIKTTSVFGSSVLHYGDDPNRDGQCCRPREPSPVSFQSSSSQYNPGVQDHHHCRGFNDLVLLMFLLKYSDPKTIYVCSGVQRRHVVRDFGYIGPNPSGLLVILASNHTPTHTHTHTPHAYAYARTSKMCYIIHNIHTICTHTSYSDIVFCDKQKSRNSRLKSNPRSLRASISFKIRSCRPKFEPSLQYNFCDECSNHFSGYDIYNVNSVLNFWGYKSTMKHDTAVSPGSIPAGDVFGPNRRNYINPLHPRLELSALGRVWKMKQPFETNLSWLQRLEEIRTTTLDYVSRDGPRSQPTMTTHRSPPRMQPPSLPSQPSQPTSSSRPTRRRSRHQPPPPRNRSSTRARRNSQSGLPRRNNSTRRHSTTTTRPPSRRSSQQYSYRNNWS
jgi:hypothetical protein